MSKFAVVAVEVAKPEPLECKVGLQLEETLQAVAGVAIYLR